MDSALIDTTSEQFLGQWKRLVSTTNWEKGQIILGWRQALIEAEAPTSDYSDEAWSRRVGNVTPQHVGRLRRVFERFGSAREDYHGLFWSHFQAALDWDDAELWLEGAVQSDWSISEMRHKRWETRGELAGEEPSASDESGEAPWDEDAEAVDAGEVTTGTMETARDPERADSSSDDHDDRNDAEADDSEDDEVEAGGYASGAAASSAPVRPFAALPPLPPDVNDAFEAYKLCILRHKMGGWQDISLDDMVMSLEALKQLTLAPPEL